MNEAFFFTFAARDTYEDIARWRADPADPRFRRMSRGVVTVRYEPGWAYRANGMWTVCTPAGHELADQGWKLHVAVTPESFERVLGTVAERCYANRIPFKHLARRELAWLVNAKYAPRTASGKGIAIYPSGAEDSVRLARELREALAGERGPRILTDLQVDDSVVHARYGAYRRRFCRDESGAVRYALRDPAGHLVPDRRAVPFTAPAFVTVPEEFRRRPPAADGPLPPYRVDKTLHFSNGGGVYLATDLNTDRPVVLKEARPYAGYDLVGGDSVARATHEYRMLREFDGHPGFPRAHEQFTWQGHVFTAVEHVVGSTLQEWCATHHPYLLRDDPLRPPAAAEIDHYRADVTAVTARLRAIVADVWARGYAVGDLHPGNVMVTSQLDVKVIDLEACSSVDGERVLGGAPGFTAAAKQGRAADEHALNMVELSCYVPLTQLTVLDPAKLRQFVEDAVTCFRLPREWGARLLRENAGPAAVTELGTDAPSPVGPASGPDFAGWAAQIVGGLEATVDEARADRLFPCDHTGFAMPSVCLATGAAGVLWSLGETKEVSAGPLSERIADWIMVNSRAAGTRLECGLYDSELGGGYALWRTGRPAEGAWLVAAALAKDRDRCGLSVFAGLAGMYLAAAEMAAGPDAIVPMTVAEELGAELVRRAGLLRRGLAAAGRPTVSAYGLMHGLSGVTLAVHRYGTDVGDPAAVELARDLMDLELAGFVRRGDGSLQLDDDGKRTLAYLETGSCGTALVLSELTRHDDWRPAGGATVDDLIRALGPEMMFQVGLFRGRAGFLAALRQLAGNGHEIAGPLVNRHLDRLGLHELRPRLGELHFPGSGNWRIAADLRTGGAGVLTAVAYASDRRDRWLPGLW
ncbi:class III lanthionine synthetase LanKC [Polymorphospora rubra]|uniref:class III lanthionine synthetase LanKC n=1 Tax=Polymorphospora rubra TaxID=338584 RepID=UPI0033C7D18D